MDKDKEILKQNKTINTVLGFSLFVLGTIVFLSGETFNSILCYIIGALMVISSYYFFNKVFLQHLGLKRLEFGFKKELMEKLLKEVFGEATYDPVYYLSENDYMKSEFSNYGNIYRCSDTIISEVNGIKFDCSDIEYLIEDSNGKYDERTVLFNGLFFRFYFGINSEVKVKLTEKNNLKVNNEGYQKIEVESIEFNNKFNIYATDAKEAFYLANPKYMEELLKLEKEVQGDFYLLYKNGILYLLIDRIGISFKLKNDEEYSPKLEAEFKKYLEEIKLITEKISSK